MVKLWQRLFSKVWLNRWRLPLSFCVKFEACDTHATSTRSLRAQELAPAFVRAMNWKVLFLTSSSHTTSVSTTTDSTTATTSSVNSCPVASPPCHYNVSHLPNSRPAPFTVPIPILIVLCAAACTFVRSTCARNAIFLFSEIDKMARSRTAAEMIFWSWTIKHIVRISICSLEFLLENL